MDLNKVAIHNEVSKEAIPEEYTKISIEDLSNKQSASLKDIFVGDYLCFLSQEDMVSTVSLIVSKMRYGSKLTVTGNDILEIARLVMNRNLSLGDARSFLYSGRKSSYTHPEIAALLESKGLKTSRKILNGLTYCIIMERPDVTTKK